MASDTIGTSCPDDGIKPVTAKVATDLSSWQYKAVKLSADRTIAAQTTAGATMYGILQDAPDGSTTATVGSVKTHGHSFAIAGGTCTVGGLGTIITTTGLFVNATGSDKEAVVKFVEGTTTSGDRIIVDIVHAYQAS